MTANYILGISIRTSHTSNMSLPSNPTLTWNFLVFLLPLRLLIVLSQGPSVVPFVYTTF